MTLLFYDLKKVLSKKKFVAGFVKAQTQWKTTKGEKALWVKAAKDYI
jgi:hypothetical protein